MGFLKSRSSESYVFVGVLQLVPRLNVCRLHESLCQFSRGVSSCLLHSRDESLRLSELCAFLRLLLTASSYRIQLRGGVYMVELGPELNEPVEPSEVELV